MTTTEYKNYVEYLKGLADGTELVDCFGFTWVKKPDGIYSIDGAERHLFFSLFMPHDLRKR